MILRKIHAVGQRYFPIPAYLALIVITGYSITQAVRHRGEFMLWLGPIQASLPFLILMVRIQIKKDLLRTNRDWIGALALSGCIWTAAYCMAHVHLSWRPIALCVGATAIFLIDTYGYNHLGRPEKSGDLALGRKFPELTLKDYQGTPQNLKDLLRRPALILFIRGSWCPLCMAQVREVAGAYKELDARGIRVIVITAQTQESSQELAKRHNVPITYLVDDELVLAKKLDLVHKNGVPVGLSRGKYGAHTIFPTAIITNERGEVIYVDQTDDITLRPEPETFLKVLDEYQVNHELENKVQERTAEVRDLLDNIGEGFFSFGADFSVHKEKSKICEAIFGSDIKYRDPLTLLGAKDPEGLRKLLGMVFEGHQELELIRELLPKDVKLGEGIFELLYRWVPAENEGKQPKVLVITRDVTHERKLAADIAVEEELNNMIVRVAIDRDGFVDLLGEVQTVLSRIEQALAQPPALVNIDELFRYFHTIKGGMGIFGLVKVARAAHAIEGDLAGFRGGKSVLGGPEKARLQSQTEELRGVLDGQLDEISAIISRDDLAGGERYFRVASSQINLLSKDILAQIPKDHWVQVRTRIEYLKKQPLKAALRRLVSLAKDLGPRLDKKLHVEVTGDAILVLYEKLEPVFGALVHLIRNSVDHGLETPDDRVKLGKPEEGTLKFNAFKKGNDLKLFIGDDGGGIRVEAIKRVALEKKLVSEDELSKLSAKEIRALIFSPGFSTKTEVTDVSGRGVGMNAVKAAVEEINGRIHIHSQEGKGTIFEIDLPDVA